MYHTQCDWCGEVIDTAGDQYIRASIELVTHERDYLNKREKQIEPTRFFHVVPIRGREALNRLGIEVRNEKIGDCCYTRALRAIEGGDFDEPDAGLEWRLMPVGETGEASEERGGWGQGNKTPAPTPVEAHADLEAFLATLAPSANQALRRKLKVQGVSSLEQLDAMSDDEMMALEGVAWNTRCKIRDFIAARNTARVSADDADRDIGWLSISVRTYNALHRSGVRSLVDLQKSVKDGGLLAIPGIGEKALDEIEAALDELLKATA